MRHSAISGLEECGYRRSNCNHGMLARSSSESDIVAVTGYPGNLDMGKYEEEEDSEDDRDDDEYLEAERNQQEQLPYPGFIPISMKYLDQNSRPRNWCLAMITNPYPFYNLI
ncbi:voltage-dependent T-type calcium channel subunit alpha-1G-like [Daktulosphaira vitifoliae]|uniref:voltage-dependent T-type calcium channel subunit alpha-1G-like n=1 Tax=Daktulosphaira vitifoliae TaxID=58002 RepID=UPI0021A9BA28|nr:voltage-dependent T-type calcium channel subunit alpha-1G-like [Daktulosphaira vitifoliae]